MENSVETLAKRTFEEFRNGSIPLGIATAKLDTKVTNGITGIEMQINESVIDENNLTLKIQLITEPGVITLNGGSITYFVQEFESFKQIQAWWNMNYAKFAMIKYNRE